MKTLFALALFVPAISLADSTCYCIKAERQGGEIRYTEWEKVIRHSDPKEELRPCISEGALSYGWECVPVLKRHDPKAVRKQLRNVLQKKVREKYGGR